VEPIVVVIKVGHIEAKKDTYQILLNTVTPSMNEAIKRIKQGGCTSSIQQHRNRTRRADLLE
jgi:hypothetical protein